MVWVFSELCKKLKFFVSFPLQNEVDFHNYKYSVYENEALIYGLYSSSVKVFQEVLETWDGYQEYIPKIQTFMQQIGEIGRKSQTANKPNNGYNVLNHGDFHLRNILVKLDSQNRLQQFNFVRSIISILLCFVLRHTNITISFS